MVCWASPELRVSGCRLGPCNARLCRIEAPIAGSTVSGHDGQTLQEGSRLQAGEGIVVIMYWGIVSASVVCVSVGVALIAGEPQRSSCDVSYTEDGSEVVTCSDGSSLSMGVVGTEVVTDEADFRGRSLRGLDFRFVELQNARFQKSRLNEVNFRGVDLAGADFSGATLINVELSSANLTGVNFKGSKLDGVQVKGAVWSETTCPTGISSDDNGGTCLGQMKP